MCPTPVLYFSIPHLSVDGGIMITGSHNPPEFNGIKMALGKTAIYGAQIQEIRRLIETDDLEKGARGAGEEIRASSNPTSRGFRRTSSSSAACASPWIRATAWAGWSRRRFSARWGRRCYELFSEVDGRFPNHHPDPTVEKNLADLKKAVKEKGARSGRGLRRRRRPPGRGGRKRRASSGAIN